MRLLNIALILAVVAATMAHASGPQSNLKSATDKPPDQVVRWFEKATRAMARDDNSAAIAGFDRVIAAYPAFDAAIYNRALVLAEMGRDREAMADLARLRQLASPQADKLAALFLSISMASESIARAGFQAGELQRAEQQIARALIFDPTSADAYIYRDLVRNSQNRTDEALADYAAAIARDPKSSIAHFNRAAILLVRQQYREAIESFTRVIEIEPADADAYQGRAQAYEALGERTSAAKDRDTYRRLCQCVQQ